MVFVSQEGGLKLTFQKQGLAQKRPFDSEDCALGQQQYLTRLRELQSASETSLASFPKSVPGSGDYAGNRGLRMKYFLSLPKPLSFTFIVKIHWSFNVRTCLKSAR